MPAQPPQTEDSNFKTAGYRLDPLFNPESVAVIGASEKAGSVGRAVLENLKDFSGVVLPVNPKRKTILGRKAFSSISDLPQSPDLAIIVTPAPTVPGVVRDCAARNIPGAIIISAGFKEVGKEGVDLEQEVLSAARAGHMRVIGPNCLGVMTPHHGFNGTFATGMAKPGKVAFLSQSGALCTAILDWSFRENVGFSAFVSIGSMLDVGWGDLLYHLGNDPHTQSIVIYMESIGDARSFLSAAREIAPTKPILVIKVGRTEAAAQAAASHTGSLTGRDDVLDAAFRRVGVLRVQTIGELFRMAEVLAKQPRPQGPRLAVITNAGGPAALSTDMLITSGGELANPSSSTLASLNKFLPDAWSHSNPIDILGDADADRYARTLEIAAQDDNTDGMLVILTPQKMTEATATAEKLKPFNQRDGKPLLASWMGGPETEEGERILSAAGVPVFPYPDAAARAFAMMWRYKDNLRALYECPTLSHPSNPSPVSGPDMNQTEHIIRVLEARPAVENLISNVRQEKRTLLTEFESKRILATYGIPVVETRVADSEAEAVDHAKSIGFPVVLKLYSNSITHKTDVDGVHLNLSSPQAVQHAWQAIKTSVANRVGGEHFQGVTVQPMVSFEGYELILGSSIDPQFGPVLLFGAGGQLVEIFKDRALGLPPLTNHLARWLMEETRIFQALKGTRGRPAVDLVELEDLLVRFSQLVVEHPWIAEIDLNPLLASPEGILALDARVLLHDSSTSTDLLPRPAIRAYPTQYIDHIHLQDGTHLTIRPIRPEDEPMMVAFHHTLSERSVYNRYFSPLKLELRIAHERLARLCFIDYDREMALVAVRKNPDAGKREIVGVGRLSKMHFCNEAEFSMVLSDQWQGAGIGTRLLQLLIAVGRDEDLDRITGSILRENHEMLELSKKAGFEIHRPMDGGECQAVLELGSRPALARAA